MSKARKQLPLPDEASPLPPHKNRALPSLPSPDDAPPPPIPARPGAHRPVPPVPNTHKVPSRNPLDSNQHQDNDSNEESGADSDSSYEEMDKPPPGTPPRGYKGSDMEDHHDPTTPSPKPRKKRSIPPLPTQVPKKPPHVHNHQDLGRANTKSVTSDDEQEPGIYADAEEGSLYDEEEFTQDDSPDQENYDEFEIGPATPEKKTFSDSPTQEVYDDYQEEEEDEEEEQQNYDDFEQEQQTYEMEPQAPIQEETYEAVPEPPSKPMPSEAPRVPPARPAPSIPVPPPAPPRDNEHSGDELYEPLPESPWPSPPPARKAEAKPTHRPPPKPKELTPAPKGKGPASAPVVDLNAIMNKRDKLRKVGQPVERQNSDPKEVKEYGDTSELRNAFDIFRAREKESGGKVPPPLKKTPSSDSTGRSPVSPNFPTSPKPTSDTKPPPKSIQRPKSSPPPPPIDRPPLPGNHPSQPPPPTSSLPPPPVRRENYTQVNKAGKTEFPPPPPEMNGGVSNNDEYDNDSDGEIYDEAFSKNDPMLIHDWYFGEIERDKGNNLLNTVSVNGTYLVRKSTRGGDNQPYTLMVMYNSHIYNLKVRIRNDTRYALGEEKSDEISFKSVEDLISHHQKNDVILVNRSGQRYETVLKHIPKH